MQNFDKVFNIVIIKSMTKTSITPMIALVSLQLDSGGFRSYYQHYCSYCAYYALAVITFAAPHLSQRLLVKIKQPMSIRNSVLILFSQMIRNHSSIFVIFEVKAQYISKFLSSNLHIFCLHSRKYFVLTLFVQISFK